MRYLFLNKNNNFPLIAILCVRNNFLLPEHFSITSTLAEQDGTELISCPYSLFTAR